MRNPAVRKIVAEAATRLREDLLKIAASLVARRMEGVDGEYVVISVLASGEGGEGPDPPSPSLLQARRCWRAQRSACTKPTVSRVPVASA